MELVRLLQSDGTWEKLREEWRNQTLSFNEDFESYASGMFSVVSSLAEHRTRNAGVFGLQREGSFIALCQLNQTPLPGYDSPVLRMRFMTLAPQFDFGEFELDQYVGVLIGLFSNVLLLSNSDDEFGAKHLKFHLRSPADRQFFAAVATPLEKSEAFSSVQVRGSWLYITKK